MKMVQGNALVRVFVFEILIHCSENDRFIESDHMMKKKC